MKAAVFKAIGEPLLVESRPDPVPGAGEVVVAVDRCGICGSDLHMTEDPVFSVAPGSVLGHEYCGEIVAAGGASAALKVGDRVAVMPLRGCGRCADCGAGRPSWCSAFRLEGGGYAEYTLAATHQCVKLPAMISSEDAALTEPLAVALHGVALAHMPPGARVLVIGAGPIGLGVAFWARRHGAGQVAVTDLYTYQRERALQMGATVFVEHAENPVAAVNAALRGAPDIVFECVGKPGLLKRSIEHVRPRGTIIVLGLCTAPDTFIPFEAVSKEVRIQTSAFFHAQEFCAAVDVLEAGQAAPHALITDTVSLAQMPAAFEALRRRTTQCKVMVAPR
jgi:(R,R)-butanediol dehydrogenase/meso-butanediol dehydrogenase/diacetyl reductase